MSLWDTHATTIHLDRFRGHDQFLEQADSYPYEALTGWIAAKYPWDLELGEDDAFGCVTRIVNGRKVSRDLLDSILEFEFLSRFMPMAYRSVIDIGAGYGRLAHRITQAFVGTFVHCTDPIAVSRICCEKYLAHRHVSRAMVVAPADLGNLTRPIDLAINVHSWSECSMSEVCSWLDWLCTAKVRSLFIVPHTPSFGTWSPEKGGGNGPSYVPELEARGYRMAHHWTGPECCPRTYSLWEMGT
jgi:hypothetical protein